MKWLGWPLYDDRDHDNYYDNDDHDDRDQEKVVWLIIILLLKVFKMFYTRSKHEDLLYGDEYKLVDNHFLINRVSE